MQVKILDLESKLFGRKVIRISDPEDANEVISTQDRLVKKYGPAFIYCVVEAHEIDTIQALENSGYGFSEFRIHSWLQITEKPPAANMFPYRLEPIGDKSQLESVQEILQSGTPDDRFFNDPLVDADIARKRELINVEKSFHSWPKEFLLGLFNAQTNKLMAFRSGAFKSEREATFYLYGVSPAVDHDQFSRLLDHCCIDFLYTQGVRIIHCVSTGFNTSELNRLILHHGFKVGDTEVVLRKVVFDKNINSQQ